MIPLLKRRETAQERLQRLEREVAAAVADGDTRNLERLRAERAALRDEVEDLAAGAELLAQREAEAAAEDRRVRTNAARREARLSADALKVLGANVDHVLEELERAVAAYGEQALELADHLRASGLSDGGRIGNTMKPNVRWSTYRSAPTYAELAGVPRVPVPRRDSLEALSARIIPAIEEENS